MILHLTLRPLDGRYHGRGDAGKPEWPPSPFRVFQALLAGAKSQWSPQRADAFAWIERLSPPVIHAPKARKNGPLLTYVPNNNPNHQRTEKTIHPHILPGGLKDWRIDYFWAFDASNEQAGRHAGVIAQCARHVRCLGWGIDMAIGDGEIIGNRTNPPEGFIAHVPFSPNRGGIPLRIPTRDSLQSLEQAHDAAMQRIQYVKVGRKTEMQIHDNPGRVRFDLAMYGSSPARPFCTFVLQKPDIEEETLSFNPRRIKHLVGMIRGLLNTPPIHKALGTDTVNRMILGHDANNPGPRLSILPLLSVGHPNADARIRRVILAEPFDGDGSICHQLAEILNGKDLVPHSADKPVARLRCLSPYDRYIRKWYAGSSCQWASVSPVLLPGFDHPRSKSGAGQLKRAEKLVCKTLSHADINLSCRIEISPLSWWPGVPHARDFVPRDKLGPAPRYHVKLTFDQPFTGPLSLGRQRHMGLGVFAAMSEQ